MENYSIVLGFSQSDYDEPSWTIKLEGFYGEVLEEGVYPVSRFNGPQAVHDFMQSMDTIIDDVDTITSNSSVTKNIVVGKHTLYGIEFRDMNTAIHVVLAYADESTADMLWDEMESDVEYEIGRSAEHCDEMFEINFRDVEYDPVIGQWYIVHGDYICIIVNTGHEVPDVYL